MLPNRGFGEPILWAGAAAALTASAALTLLSTRIPSPISDTIIPSPRTTLLPHLTPEQVKSLGYPPDALPGARDVNTPYGSMRVYEWGPEDGRKVIMVHGDATPSPMFGRIAKVLTARGCRVLTFDLWGRGYSDTPSGTQHNSRLYMNQILYAITSSPLSWTGSSSNRFSLIGFSLGGAITLDFTRHHAQLIESIVLLGPAGLIRTLPAEYTSFFFRYTGLASSSKMRRLIGTALGVDLSSLSSTNKASEKVVVVPSDFKTCPTIKPTGFTPSTATQFQFDQHKGHVESFLSTIQYGPIQNCEVIWQEACDIISGRRWVDSPLCGGKILVICGEDDTVIPAQDVREDLNRFLGVEGGYWEFGTVPGGHGFPWPEGENVGERIAAFWGLREEVDA